MLHVQEACTIPCVRVVCLQLIIIALKGLVILQLHTEEDCLLENVPCMWPVISRGPCLRAGSRRENQTIASGQQEKAQGELAHVLIGAHSVLLVFSQAGEVKRAAASASAAFHKAVLNEFSDILDAIMQCPAANEKGADLDRAQQAFGRLQVILTDCSLHTALMLSMLPSSLHRTHHHGTGLAPHTFS